MRLFLRALALGTAVIAAPAAAQTPGRAELAKVVASRHDTTIKALQEWIALPTIAAEKRNVEQGANYMRKLALDAGFQKARVVQSGGVPGVFATLDAGAPVTLGIYFMYDVKQFDPAEWSSPPLEGRLVDRPGEGQVMMGRGAVNQKGPQMAFLAALHAFKASGRKLPVNLVLVAEGEEEIASPNLPAIVANSEVQRALTGAVGVFMPEAPQDKTGRVNINLGAKGAVEFQLVVGGETSGRYPKREVHSGSAARIANPAWHLIKALDTLVADDGFTPAVDGWMDKIVPPTERQRELVRQRAAADDEAGAKASSGVERWINDEDFLTSSYRLVERPTINVQGLVAGYSGPGGKTIIPARAEAKLEARLVPNMTADDAVAKLQAHLAKRGFDDVRVQISGRFDPNEVSEDTPMVRANAAVMKQKGISYSYAPRSPGGWPGVVFNGAPLNLPTGQFGIGRGNGAHAPNEWFLIRSANPKVGGIDEATMLYVDYLYEVAKLGRR